MITRGCLVDRPSLDSLVALAAIAFDVPEDDLLGPDRTYPIVKYRQVVMAAAHRLGHSFPVIARAFNGRDHTTVMHASQSVDKDAHLSSKADILVKELKAQTGSLV